MQILNLLGTTRTNGQLMNPFGRDVISLAISCLKDNHLIAYTDSA
jgi:hypothetical protein